MDAKKCDRCGCYYDDNSENKPLLNNAKKISKYTLRGYGIGVCFKDIYGTASFRSFDLCPCCVAEFINWFEEDK